MADSGRVFEVETAVSRADPREVFQVPAFRVLCEHGTPFFVFRVLSSGEEK